MIDAALLLNDLRRLLRTLESDLREAHAGSETGAGLRAEWQAARDAGRTGGTFEAFLDDALTQSAVHWVLGCVFLRFLEDNGLVERPWLAGPGERMHLARDRHEAYFRARPHDSDRDYLLVCFREVAALPGLKGLFDERHNPLFRLPLSGDGGMALLGFFRKLDPDSGRLVHDFTDPGWDTRFLGDLYQDLSEAARKRYALLQTPEFVEEFILERTLEPAIREFGFRAVRLIDPACGSGHFLLGAFRRLFDLWCRNEPGRNVRDSAQRALDAVAGVDVNPFAAEIARFRLLLAALHASGIDRLAGAPDFKVSVATGDSLLHGKRFMDLRGWQMSLTPEPGMAHVYHAEDVEMLERLLGQQYHAVVGNPPYIGPTDAAINKKYRERYSTCFRTYSLSVPFIERFFDLAIASDGVPAGFVGVITANSFMKAAFGKKLVENFLPKVDLSHVVDTSGVHLPGHGTPTVILLGRNRRPLDDRLRIIMGIRSEPEIPADPAQGLVWLAIRNQIDCPGSESTFVSVDDRPRAAFANHPWSIGGGGLSDLKSLMDGSSIKLGEIIDKPIGRAVRIALEDLYIYPTQFLVRHKLPQDEFKSLIIGKDVRDWCLYNGDEVWYPYAGEPEKSKFTHFLLRWKKVLENRSTFQGNMTDAGLDWFRYMQHTPSAYHTPLSICFAFVATHNHFVLDRGGKIYNRTAPVIKFPIQCGQDVHRGILALLNSSSAAIWLRQTMRDKGGSGIGRGVQDEPWEARYTYDGGKLESSPWSSPTLFAWRRNWTASAESL